MRISTMASLALSGAILLVLALTYMRLPPKEDAVLASFLAEPSSGKEARGAPSAAGGAGGGEERARSDLLRSLPLWSPSSAPPGEPLAPVPAAAGPDIRNIEPIPAATAGAEPAAPPPPEPAAPPGPTYMIQVRGKESMEGARRILDYLALFGFEKSQIEPDPRGDSNAEGKALYTVFVGAYDGRADADRECSRLKRATRERPFRNRPDFRDFFGDAFVIARAPR
jgi:cell division protein FtsN